MRQDKSLTGKALTLIAALSISQLPAVAETVRIAGQPVFEVSGAGGVSASRRAEIMQSNLDNAIIASYGKGTIPINVTYVKGMPVLTVGGYYVGTVDAATAKSERTTPAKLAQRWASDLRSLVSDSASMADYVAQLTGADNTAVASAPNPVTTAPTTSSSTLPETTSVYRRGHVVYIPAGLTLPVSLLTTISSETAQPGDVVEARLDQPLALGDATLPLGTVVTGRVTDANPARRLPVGGPAELKIAFDTIRLPDGSTAPISGRIVGGITEAQARGLIGKIESNRLGRTAVRGALGAGLGAGLGTAIGAIAGGGRGLVRGAWSGAAIGGGLGLLQGLLFSRGSNVIIPSGQRLDVQLDTPASVAVYGAGTM